MGGDDNDPMQANTVCTNPTILSPLSFPIPIKKAHQTIISLSLIPFFRPLLLRYHPTDINPPSNPYSSLPTSHPYVREELHQMAAQLEIERRLVGDATAWSLLKEMWTIRANRNRALLSIGLMIGQQLTGINAINYYAPQIFKSIGTCVTPTYFPP